MQIRTVAAILAWCVVALLLLNSFFRSEWVLPISIVLTVIAVLVYFSPRLSKGKKSADKEKNLPSSDLCKEQ
ncbi:MAG TPA: hypothetical protein ENN36_01875 [Candidatus Bathyarchaeota archaeon]|nr:hypothetical protein [Candidatus Bathyarchaeota archaeon]